MRFLLYDVRRRVGSSFMKNMQVNRARDAGGEEDSGGNLPGEDAYGEPQSEFVVIPSTCTSQ